MEEPSWLVKELPHATEYGNSDGESESALGGSISFGRFLSESLDWGKWSSFSQKRYLEEAEKYSIPGSVAQKKAYFEANYKKAAAKKSAVLVEQANSVLETKSNTRIGSNDGSNSNSFDVKAECEKDGEVAAGNEAAQVEVTVEHVDLFPGAKEPSLDEENYVSERGEVEQFDSTMEDEGLVESSSQIDLPGIIDDVENQNMATEMGPSRENPLEKQPLKESSVTNQGSGKLADKMQTIPISKSLVICKPSRLPPCPAPKLLSSSKPMSSFHCIQDKSTRSSKKDGKGLNEKNKSAMSSLHMSINLTETRSGSMASLLTKASPIVKKVEELKVANISSKECQDHLHCATRITKASLDGAPRLATCTSKSEHGRIKTPSEQTLPGSERMGAKLHNFLKSSSIRGSKVRTKVTSSSLSIKTDERIEKKKLSHNLNNKSDQKETNQLQLQGTPKEKAESEIRKLRQSLCFKARPLPDFYRNIEPRKIEINKIPLTQPKSPKLRSKSNSKANAPPKSLPPWRSSMKRDQSVHTIENSTRISSHSTTSIRNKNKTSVSLHN